MSEPVPPPPNKSGIIICDTNVVILMTLFKSSVMFKAKYSFGAVKVHHTVIEELERWVERNNAKIRKFTKPIVEQAIELCNSCCDGIKEPTPAQDQKSRSYITAKENSISAADKGAATSATDKSLLILAYVNKAYLATQERTMTAVARQTLPADQVLRFEDLVLDLIRAGHLTLEDLNTGLDILNKFGEVLAHEKVAAMKSHFDT